MELGQKVQYVDPDDGETGTGHIDTITADIVVVIGENGESWIGSPLCCTVLFNQDAIDFTNEQNRLFAEYEAYAADEREQLRDYYDSQLDEGDYQQTGLTRVG